MKKGKCIGFCVYLRSYLLWSLVVKGLQDRTRRFCRSLYTWVPIPEVDCACRYLGRSTWGRPQVVGAGASKYRARYIHAFAEKDITGDHS